MPKSGINGSSERFTFSLLNILPTDFQNDWAKLEYPPTVNESSVFSNTLSRICGPLFVDLCRYGGGMMKSPSYFPFHFPNSKDDEPSKSCFLVVPHALPLMLSFKVACNFNFSTWVFQ